MVDLDQSSTISLGLVVTTIGAIWRVSALAARMELGLSKLADDVRRVENGLVALAVVPVHESRIAQLERLTTDIVSRIDNLGDRCAELARKIAVTRERLASEHDLTTIGESDRPPK